MCKTDEKTRQYFYFCIGLENVAQRLRLIGFAKTHDELIFDFDGQKTKPNTTVFHSCTITANILENNKNIKAKNSCKNHSENKKSSNFFPARRKYYGAAKER